MNKITHALAATLLLGSGFAAHAQDGDLIAKGQALAIASDCMACHTNTQQQGKPFAGGTASLPLWALSTPPILLHR